VSFKMKILVQSDVSACNKSFYITLNGGNCRNVIN